MTKHEHHTCDWLHLTSRNLIPISTSPNMNTILVTGCISQATISYSHQHLPKHEHHTCNWLHLTSYHLIPISTSPNMNTILVTGCIIVVVRQVVTTTCGSWQLPFATFVMSHIIEWSTIGGALTPLLMLALVCGQLPTTIANISQEDIWSACCSVIATFGSTKSLAGFAVVNQLTRKAISAVTWYCLMGVVVVSNINVYWNVIMQLHAMFCYVDKLTFNLKDWLLTI